MKTCTREGCNRKPDGERRCKKCAEMHEDARKAIRAALGEVAPC